MHSDAAAAAAPLLRVKQCCSAAQAGLSHTSHPHKTNPHGDGGKMAAGDAAGSAPMRRGVMSLGGTGGRYPRLNFSFACM